MKPPTDRAAVIMDQWRTERPDLDSSSIGVITRIWQIGQICAARRRDLLSDLDIDTALMDLLGTLRRSGAPYSLSTRELAQATGVTPAAISQRLTRAQERGWVTREQLARRAVQVHLTEDGRRTVDNFAGAIFEADDDLLAVLQPEEREALTELLTTMVRRLTEDATP